jgi:hypothetical protein
VVAPIILLDFATMSHRVSRTHPPGRVGHVGRVGCGTRCQAVGGPIVSPLDPFKSVSGTWLSGSWDPPIRSCGTRCQHWLWDSLVG